MFAKGFKKLPKVQKIAQSGHTAPGIKSRLFIVSMMQWITEADRDRSPG